VPGIRGVIVAATLVLASLTATLATLECGVRVYASLDRNHLDALMDEAPVTGRELRIADMIRRSPDDQIVYEFRPGTEGRFYGHEVRINALGMRDRERTAQKPAGVFRILVLGDSHGFGWRVAQDESFAAVLQALLDARAPGRFEVLNAGIPGYNTVMEARVFEHRADELAPDLVLIHFVDNDMDLPNFLSDPPDAWSLKHSFLLELIERRLALLAGDQELLPRGLFVAAMDPKRGRFHIPDDLIPERYRPLQGWDAMRRAYHRLAQRARAEGIPHAVLVNAHDYRAQLAGDPGDVQPQAIRDLKQSLAAEDGYLVIDPQVRVLAYLREHQLTNLALWVDPSDSHMSALHHRLAADEILEQLTTAGVLPINPD
jgi:hypothetical protein